MFHWSKEDLSVENSRAPENYRKHGDRGNGGWTTKRSFQGLVRRLLHAIMTQDTFTVVSKYLLYCTKSVPIQINLHSANLIFSSMYSLLRTIKTKWVVIVQQRVKGKTTKVRQNGRCFLWE